VQACHCVSMENASKRLRSSSTQSSNDVVTFNVGGRHFEVLKLTIQRHPSTLLAQLLDDISTSKDEVLFVDANPDRFQYILDWYRHGAMFVRTEWIPALLLDARYFLLPDCVKINGRKYDLQPPTLPCVQEIFDEQKAKVIAKWPSFKGYVKRLAEETMAKAMHSDHDSVIDLVKQKRGSVYFGRNGSHGHTDLSSLGDNMCWHEVQISGRRSIEYDSDSDDSPAAGPVHFPSLWNDKDNVCNAARLQVLVQELQSLGFDCRVHHFGTEITLRVGVNLRRSPPLSIAIEGVDTIEDNGYRALAVAKTWDQTKDQ